MPSVLQRPMIKAPAKPAASQAELRNRIQQRLGSADFSRITQRKFTYWDYVQYPAAGASELNFFVVPNGQADTYLSSVTKTLEHTNLVESRSFGKVDFIIKTIRTHIRLAPKNRQNTNTAALANLITHSGSTLGYRNTMISMHQLSRQGVLVFSIGQKEYADVNQPFITCPPGFGLKVHRHAVSSAASTVSGESCLFQQDADADSVYNIPGQMIEAGQTFQTTIKFPNANSPALADIYSGEKPRIEIGIILEGFLLAPVQ